MNYRKVNLYYLTFLLPCIIIGTLSMYLNNIPIITLIQNPLVYIVGIFISFFLFRLKPDFRWPNIILISISILMLILTLFSLPVEGVTRWIHIGPIGLNISMIVLPILIVEIYKIKNWWVSFFICFFTSIILMLQPDASQNTSFVLAALVILIHKNKRGKLKLLSLVLIVLTSIYSWINLDSLGSVPYVEGILTMLMEMGNIWFILGVSSLVLLVFPFIIFFFKTHSWLYIGMAIYILSTIITPIFGNFPIPILGYGASPIIGYFISVYYLETSIKYCNKLNFSLYSKY